MGFDVRRQITAVTGAKLVHGQAAIPSPHRLKAPNTRLFFRSANRDPDEQGIVLRAADRIPIGSSESGLIEELLSPTLGGTFEMIKSTFAPQSSSGGLRAARQSEDGGVLISGQLTLEIDDLTLTLEAGDSFQFTSRTYS